jgi:hypothetical protein
VLALAVGTIAGAWVVANYTISGEVGGDFTWPWRAARLLLAGQNPYQVIRPTGPFPFDAYFKYPLPAALLALPLAPLSGKAAAAVFIGVSMSLLSWALTRTDQASGLQSRWPILLSGCVLSGVQSAQWSPLLASAVLLSPWTVGLGVVKPNLGIAMFAARTNWRAVATGGLLVALSLAILPSWPLDWMHILRTGLEDHYRAPVSGGRGLLALGPALLVVLLRWRRPEARLLAVLASVPQVPTFYDQLLVLAVVPRTRLESLWLAVLSEAGFLLTNPRIVHDQRAVGVLLSVYIPSVILILRRANVSEPPWNGCVAELCASDRSSDHR